MNTYVSLYSLLLRLVIEGVQKIKAVVHSNREAYLAATGN